MKPKSFKGKLQPKVNIRKAHTEIHNFLGQDDSNRGGKVAKPKSRKQLRKEQRKLKKVSKHIHYVKHFSKNGAEEILPDDDVVDDDELEEPPVKRTAEVQKERKASKDHDVKKKADKERRRVKEEKRNHVREMKRANKDEDKVIKKIEKLLRLNKRKSKSIPKSFMDDGLDYLLEICDPEKRENIVKDEFNFAQTEDGFEEDLALIAGKEDEETKSKKGKKQQKTGNVKAREDSGSELESDGDEAEDEEGDFGENLEGEEEEEDAGSEEEDDNEEMGEEAEYDEDINDEEMSEDDAVGGQSDGEHEESRDFDDEENSDAEDDEEDEDIAANEDEAPTEGKETEDLWEDIYGRLRNKKGDVVSKSETAGKYVPPAKRFSETKDPEVERLERQLKGLLNRLAESNLPSILSTIEDLYLKHSRHTMHQVMCELIFSSLIRHTLSPERLVMEHCVLMAALHANVGTEVGAQFVETVVRKFDEIYLESHDDESKRLDNLILIISHLYNFKVVGSQLIFDILNKLADNFKEKDIELILIVIRSVGFALRKDDPIALKQVILNLQSKANAAQELRDQSRVRFMLDVLLAIRNNNIAKIPNYDPSHTEHMRKILRNGLVRKDASVSQLKISYQELMSTHTRGRWWVVGSAWAGEGPTVSSSSSGSKEPQVKDHQFSAELLELARKQRMNTDARRNIFCIIMSSEDYVEASERLLSLGLKNQQEREIVNVVIDCCLQEKKYNPFYSHLAQKLLNTDRKYQMAFQFCVWDRLKEVASLKSAQVMNLAKIIGHVIAEQSLTLAVLKVIPFAEMDKTLVRFLRLFLLELFLHQSEQTIKTVFLRIANQAKFHLLREGLRLFMHHFLLTNVDKMEEAEAQSVRSGVEAADQALNISAVKL